MTTPFRRLMPTLLLVFFMAVPAFAEPGMAPDPSVCLGCHGDRISAAEFAASPHGKNSCTSCHAELTDLARHESGELMPGKVRCERCHAGATAEHLTSVHMQNAINCTDCHSGIHVLKGWKKDKRKVVETCSQCHDKEARDFLGSSHGKALLAANQESPSCNDCHGLHDMKSLGDVNSAEHKKFNTQACLKCHGNEEMMKRHGVTTLAVKTFQDSYHGKNFSLGFTEKTAGCADCHTSHLVLPPGDPKSTVNPKNLVDTCAKCHRGATAGFAKFHPHGDPSDRENFPLLFWTLAAMTGLLAVTFAIFWVHSLLWMFRGFVENRRKQALLEEGDTAQAIPDGHKQFRRFKWRHVILHLMVVTSFLGLAMTGLPLKFSDQQWAVHFMRFFGGAANAGFIHRVCAVVTFGYFTAAILLSLHFLFVRKDIKGNWLQRLFGPDSLFPNLRDVKDVTAMMRWFLFRGPKPTFDRWTYWEKFDFLAVFWGMFAIGGSGLLLWFPEFFGQFLPGWMFNIATLVHSDEALLATGFIFTVHFFNTHARPEKFPMDFVIFNGRISKHEMLEERGDQWKRYEEGGITEQFKADKPSGVLFDFFLKGFGFLALFTGLGLLALMIYTFFKGGGH